MNTHKATQVAHPWRAALRTAVQILIPATILFVVAEPIITEELGPYLPAHWQAAYAGAAAFLTAAGAALARVMALPAAQRLLSVIGLGTGEADG